MTTLKPVNKMELRSADADLRLFVGFQNSMIIFFQQIVRSEQQDRRRRARCTFTVDENKPRIISYLHLGE